MEKRSQINNLAKLDIDLTSDKDTQLKIEITDRATSKFGGTNGIEASASQND